MSESSISVAVRVRPFSNKEAALLAPQDSYQPFLGDGGLSSGPPAKGPPGTGPGLRTKYLRSIVAPVDDKVLIFDPPEDNPLARLYSSSTQNTFAHGARKPRDIRYAFDRVFDDKCGQETVFENTTKPLLDGILNGFNASVFAYGATGCGKTHTISGTPEDPGVIFLTMRELYRRIEESRDEHDVQIRLSYLEIYNEQIRDLLSPTPTPPGPGLMLREDATNRISVVGITAHVPESPERVLEMIQEGNQRRTMSPTEANAVSSRSHAVLQINVTQRPRTADTVMETTSASLNIIDLAGSERAAATRNNGARMKEGANINKSLLALGNCINALCQSGGQKGRHIPYRNSKLTRLLKFSLGGNCKTVMIVCVSPSSAHYDETHNTLKYANQAKNIRTKVSRNMLNVDRHVAQYVQAIHELKEEVAELKAKLADRASVESASEKRRKAEMATEIEDVKVKMRSSTENIKDMVAHKAGLEGLLLAANIRLAPIRQRLQLLEDETQSQEGTAHVDVENEKQVVRKLIARQEAILADRTMQADAQGLANSLQMYRGAILAASNNAKFDESATSTVRMLGDAMLAEVEAYKSKMVCETMSKQLGAGMGILADFAVLGARSTMALKEAANEVEAASSSENSSAEQATPILVTQLRAVSRTNDEVFARHIGLQTSQAPQSPTTLRTSVLRRARSTASIKSNGTSAAGAAAAAAAARTSMHKRTSLVPGSSASLANNTALPSKTPRRPSVRRSSIGMRRISQTSRRVSQNANGAGQSTATSAASDLAPKKSFRWADEAGEGSIDDKKVVKADDFSVAPVTAPRASHGPSRSIRTSLSTSLGLTPAFAAPSLTAIRVEMESGANDVASSSAEWEDVSKEGLDSATARKPLGPSALANGEPTAHPGASKKRNASTIFGPNFLRKKTNAAGQPMPSADAMDTDESLEDAMDVQDIAGAAAGPASLNSDGSVPSRDDGEQAAVDDSSDGVKSLSAACLGASVRSSPYQRRRSSASSSATTTSGSIGPIRNRARAGATGEQLGRKATTATTASQAVRSSRT